MSDLSRLDPTKSDRARYAGLVFDYIESFLARIPDANGYTTGDFPKLDALRFGEPKRMEYLLAILRDEVDAVGINTASGRHLGYIPGGGLWTSSLADQLAAATNRYAGVAYSNPGSVRIENQVIEWMCDIVGYPHAAYGNLTSGGSIANLVGIQAARDEHGINSTNVRDSVIYVSPQTHHCVKKAFHITGLYEAVLRIIPMDARFRMRADLLRDQIHRDVNDGLNPFLVVATAGSTDTGAVDPLNDIADVCDAADCWLHVDGAYGGFFTMVPELHDTFRGLERSDSLVLDPHKTLFLPYGSGAVLLRDRERLLASNSTRANYMKDAYINEDISPSDTGPELSRHNRALRIWLPLHLHGVQPFIDELARKRELCLYFHERVAELGFETGPDPELSITIFRVSGDGDNSETQSLVNRIHEDGRVFMSSTTIDDRLWIRCAIVSHRTERREVDVALEMLAELSRHV